MSTVDDIPWMRAALLQARYGLGRTFPNPAVGCVIVNEGHLVGIGRTADTGRPHAETEALAKAGGQSRGATAYITLEPCAHHGETPPCAEVLIESGVRRAVIGVSDPDTNVAGKGIERLSDAGLEVQTGVLAENIKEFYRPYIHHRLTGRPFVTVKIASTLDGKIALADGRSKWITGGRTRHYIHLLRACHDAIMTAAGTFQADDPMLTCRLDGYYAPQPIRVVVSSHIKLDGSSKLANESGRIIIAGIKGGDDLPGGVEALTVKAGADGRPEIGALLQALGERGIVSVMVEAGGTFLASLVKAGFVDRLIWTRASSIIGAEGLPSLGQLDLADLADGRLFIPQSSFRIDDDMIEIFIHNAHLSGG